MTIESTPAIATYVADGVTTIFPITFPFDTAADIQATSTLADGTISALNTGFSITGGGGSTGNAVFTVAPTAGVTLTFFDNPDVTQPTDYTDNDAFPAEVTENALDRLTRICKRLALRLAQSIHFDDGDPVNFGTLANVATRKGKYLFFNAVTGAIEYAVNIVTTTLTQSIIAQLLNPQIAVENNTALLHPEFYLGDVRRYGVVPNSIPAAASNRTILKALVSPGGPYSGPITFPNTTGSDIYYFDDFILVRPGCHFDLCGCELRMAKAAATGNESNAGFLHVIRDCSIIDGKITVDFATGTGQGTCIFLGGRGIDGPWPTPLYDSLLSEAMGNIVLQNLELSSNNPGGHCITGLGGLRNLIVDNVKVDGGGVANGWYYEFGWATNEAATKDRQTSHARNMHFRNFEATNLLNSGIGLECNGAYNVTVDGITVNTAASVCSFGMGESFFYRPWAANDDGKVTKRTVAIRSVVGKAIKGSGIIIQGGGSASSSYLGTTIGALSHPADYQAQTDLVSASIDGVDMNGSAGSGFGIYALGARALSVSNFRLSTFQQGIVTTNECTSYSVRDGEIVDSESFGMQIGQAVNVYSPARFSIGEITDVFIGGSGTVAPAAAISLNQTQSCKIRGLRAGHLAAYNGFTETTQLQAVTASASCNGVDIEYPTVQATTGSAPAFSLANALSSSRNCRIRGASIGAGITPTSGLWLTDLQSASAATIAGSGTITGAGLLTVRITMAGDITGVIMDAGSWPGQERTVINEANHTATFAASGTSNVADGTGDVIAALKAARYVWNTGMSLWYRG